MGNRDRSRRIARHRPPSFVERAGKLLFNPRLRRRERLERIAITVAILLLLIYFAAGSLLKMMRYLTS